MIVEVVLGRLIEIAVQALTIIGVRSEGLTAFVLLVEFFKGFFHLVHRVVDEFRETSRLLVKGFHHAGVGIAVAGAEAVSAHDAQRDAVGLAVGACERLPDTGHLKVEGIEPVGRMVEEVKALQVGEAWVIDVEACLAHLVHLAGVAGQLVKEFLVFLAVYVELLDIKGKWLVGFGRVAFVLVCLLVLVGT